MSGLTGLWCFYIGQGGRQWPKGTSADPHSPHALPSLCFTPSLLSFASSRPLHTDMHGQTLACTQTCTLSLTDSHCYAKTHTRTHTHAWTLLSHLHPLWSFWLLFVSSVCRVTRTFLSRPLGSVHPAGTDWDPTQSSTPTAQPCLNEMTIQTICNSSICYN